VIIEHALRPEALSQHVDDEYCRWFEGRDQAGTYGWLGMRIKAEEAHVHFEAVRWSPSAYRSMHGDWQDVLDYCRQRGIRILGVAGHANDRLWAKFVTRFGFPEPTPMIISMMEVPQ